MPEELFQVEVKRAIVENRFLPSSGWDVTVDLDGMERGHGSQQSPDKRKRAAIAETWLRDQGVAIGSHPVYGRTDLVAQRGNETVVIEVEGLSSKQKDQAMYSALGQLLALMDRGGPQFVLALPDLQAWRDQGAKIPRRVRELLGLEVWYVGADQVTPG